MAAKTDSSTRIFAHRILLKHVESMIGEVEGVRTAADIESIHRMRVASRRLRNALDRSRLQEFYTELLAFSCCQDRLVTIIQRMQQVLPAFLVQFCHCFV